MSDDHALDEPLAGLDEPTGMPDQETEYEPMELADTEDLPSDPGPAAPQPAGPVEESAAPARAPRVAPERPRRRSFGRVLRIQAETALAWLADYRPLGREVLTRLNNPWQVNPGAVLEYELRRAAGGRWQAADLVFNRRPGLEDLLALDEGRGLSAEGLDALQRLIAAAPENLGRVFARGSNRLRQQLLEAEQFPLPRALLRAALDHPALAASAARRLLHGPLQDPAEVARLLVLAPPREEAGLLTRLAAEHPDWLLLHLPLPEEGLVERVTRWWRATGDLRWLRQVPAERLPEAAALPLLLAGVFGDQGELPDGESEAWAAWLDPTARRRLLTAAFRDKARSGLTEDPFAGLGAELRDVLGELAADPRSGEEARALLLQRGELSPAAALDLLAKGAAGETRARLLDLLAAAPAAERPSLPAGLALQWFQEFAGEAQPTRAGLLEWLGPLPDVQARTEGWLADPATRRLGLEALCHAPAFDHGFLQRLMGKELPADLRRRLAQAVTRVSPERWQERYLVNDEERAAWQEAGVPLA